MGRPTDWHVLDLDRDPVPGEPYEVKELARKLGAFADDVAGALRSVRGLNGDSVIQEWAGLSGDEYRTQFGDLPGELDKLERSYRLASGALDDYWPQLETAQADADRALAQGRQARADLDAAKSQLSNADAWVKRAQDKSKEYQQDPKPGVPPPSEQDVRDAARNATDASHAHSTASAAVHDAQQRLDAAKELAAQAAGVRDQAASRAEHALHEASDAGIHNKHWWEKAVDWVADHWDDIVAACKVIVAVLGIVVMIIGGPLAWLVLAAAVIVLADTVMKYLQGKASLWDVLFAALDCIPMFKGLTTAGGLLKMARELPALLKSGEALERIANGIRKGGGFVRSMSRDIKTLFTCGDPIDMASGEMVMSAVDVELPGVLPLVLERHHRSGFRGGRWFGRSWASTLDQRLLLDDQGVQFTTADGMTLSYPVPEPGVEVMPVEGPRWPLAWNGRGGDPMTVTRPETGQTLHFHPQPDGTLALAAITDRNTNRITVSYDAHGVPTEVAHSGGYRIAVTTHDGRITALHLASAGDRPRILGYGYTDGDLTAITDSSGRPLRFTYDQAGRITGWEDRNGTWYAYTFDALGRCVRTDGTDGILAYTYTYHDDPRVTEATNSLGHTTRYEFNDHYQLVTETDPLGHTTHRTWDRYDHLLTLTDPLGHTTRYTYDHHGNLASAIRPDGTTTHVEFDGPNRPARITDPTGARWHAEYDRRGNVVRVTDPLGAVSRFGYDERGALVETVDAAGHRRTYDRDARGLVRRAADARGQATAFRYDAFGRLAERVEPDGTSTEYTFDIEGRLLRASRAGQAAETWSYDAEGNITAHTDAAGAVTRYEVGPFDKLVARIGPDGGRTGYTYDTELRLAQVTDPTGLVWSYTYDPAGRTVSETDFNGRTLSYVHDAAGHVVERVNGAGQTTALVYDAAGSVVERRAGDRITRFAYDGEGRLTRAVGPDAELLLERDALGRVLRETCNGATVASSYDALGHRVARTTPSGVRSVWEYDADGFPLRLESAGSTVEFTRDAVGRPTGRRFRGATITQQWDAAERLAGVDVRDAAGALRQSRTYAYRADGLPTAVQDLLAGEHRYGLDALGRVTAVAASGAPADHGAVVSEDFGYDRAGRVLRHEAGGEEAAHSYAGTLLRSAGRVRYTHDAQGRTTGRRQRLLSGGTRDWAYEWDAEDRLTAVRTPDGSTWRYRYDPLGRRIAKEQHATDGTVRRWDFFWDGPVLVESGDGTTTTTWEWDEEGRPLSQLDQREVDTRFYAIVTDLVGMPSELLDEDGAVVWRSVADLWGAVRERSESGVHCPLRYPGQYADEETGWHYNVERYYDPASGRYQSPDPLGLAPAPDPHGYVLNPTVWSDPFGLAPCKILADTDLMVKAMGGHANALAEIMSKDVHITPNQLREFLNVTNGLNARRRFLSIHNITVIGGQDAARIAGDPAFREIFDKVIKQGHSRGDAALVGFAHVTGIQAVTMERRLSNVVIHTLKFPNVIRRVI
jgi:RHS repeat-associated protein